MTGEEHADAVDTLAAAAEHATNPHLAAAYRAAANLLYQEGPTVPFTPDTILGALHTLALEEVTAT